MSEPMDIILPSVGELSEEERLKINEILEELETELVPEQKLYKELEEFLETGLTPEQELYKERQLQYNKPENVFINKTKMRASSYRKHDYVRNRLKKLNIPFYNLNDDNITATMKNIEKALKSSNQNISKSYLSSIFSTLKHLNPQITKRAVDLGYTRINKNLLIKNGDTFIKDIELIITYCMEKIKMYFSEPNLIFRNSIPIVEANMYLAITLVLVLSLRSDEVVNLTIKYLNDVKDNKSVPLRIKYSTTSANLPKIEPLFTELYPYWLNIIASIHAYNNDTTNYEEVLKNEDLKIITCSIDAINKRIRQLYIMISGNSLKFHLGLKAIKRYTITKLINYNEPALAATLNRHKLQSTTYGYNVPNAQNALDVIYETELVVQEKEV